MYTASEPLQSRPTEVQRSSVKEVTISGVEILVVVQAFSDHLTKISLSEALEQMFAVGSCFLDFRARSALRLCNRGQDERTQ